MEVDLEDGCGIVCGVGEHMEFRYDGVRSEFVLGDFLGMMIRNCVPLQRCSWLMLRSAHVVINGMN